MKAMILAAGRGERMGELTTHTPKPLIKVGNQYLIEYALNLCAEANIRDIIINVSYHAEQIQTVLGKGSQYDLNISYSYEASRLETGGGILKALPFFEDQAFLVLSSDIITDFPLQKLIDKPLSNSLAHLVMVNNPDFHLAGDFGIENGFASMTTPFYTFANIGVYHPTLFSKATPGRFPLNQLLFPAIRQKNITAEHYNGVWHNVGTELDLKKLL